MREEGRGERRAGREVGRGKRLCRIQGPILKVLIAGETFRSSVVELVSCRLPKWFPVAPPDVGSIDWAAVRAVLLAVPPAWRIACAKTWLGGWVTDTRLQNPDRRCVLGCPARCCLNHYFGCPSFRALVERMTPGPLPLAPLEALALLSPSPSRIRVVALMFQIHRLLHAHRDPSSPQVSSSVALSIAKAARRAVDLHRPPEEGA